MYLCGFKKSDSGKDVKQLQILDEDVLKMVEDKDSQTNPEEIYNIWLNSKRNLKFDDTREKQILSSLLNDYRMSVTHLQNFLDLSKGFSDPDSSYGPRGFLEQNLLRFPHAKIPSGSYGSAMHVAIAKFYNQLKSENRLPTLDHLINYFENELKGQRLTEKSKFNPKFQLVETYTYFYEDFLEQGKESLKFYYDNFLAKNANSKSIIEKDFKKAGVQLGEVDRVLYTDTGQKLFKKTVINLTGKIDKMDIDKEAKTIKVVDFKTGKPLFYFDKGDPNQRIKAWKYDLQLNFYKILVEESNDSQGCKVLEGELEFLDSGYKKYNVNKFVTLKKQITEEDKERTKNLAKIVYQKIMNLDFPDTSKYLEECKNGLEAIKQFEEDLLEGKI